MFGLRWCRWGGGGGLDKGLERWCYVCESPDSLCRWQVQVSVYCARRIPAHLRCTQWSILLHLMDICFLPCICLRQISQIQTCLCVVVEPGLVSTSPAFMRSSASRPAGPHDQLSKKTVNQDPLLGAGGFDRSTACRLCRLEPDISWHIIAVTFQLYSSAMHWTMVLDRSKMAQHAHNSSHMDLRSLS